jgi:excisionase family DNA binding protein
MMSELPEHDPLLTPGEVAAMFGVDPKTVSRWARAGKLTAVRTLGGHRRFQASEVEALLNRARDDGGGKPRSG